MTTRQIFDVPMLTEGVFPGPKEGSYYLANQEGVTLWDRYGREPMKKITEINQGDIQVKWTPNNTVFTYKNEEQKFS